VEKRLGRRMNRNEGPKGPTRYRTCLRNTILEAFRNRGTWKETESDTDWDIVWADVPVSPRTSPHPHPLRNLTVSVL
jgi:hypothetical protein